VALRDVQRDRYTTIRVDFDDFAAGAVLDPRLPRLVVLAGEHDPVARA